MTKLHLGFHLVLTYLYCEKRQVKRLLNSQFRIGFLREELRTGEGVRWDHCHRKSMTKFM